MRRSRPTSSWLDHAIVLTFLAYITVASFFLWGSLRLVLSNGDGYPIILTENWRISPEDIKKTEITFRSSFGAKKSFFRMFQNDLDRRTLDFILSEQSKDRRPGSLDAKLSLDERRAFNRVLLADGRFNDFYNSMVAVLYRNKSAVTPGGIEAESFLFDKAFAGVDLSTLAYR